MLDESCLKQDIFYTYEIKLLRASKVLADKVWNDFIPDTISIIRLTAFNDAEVMKARSILGENWLDWVELLTTCQQISQGEKDNEINDWEHLSTKIQQNETKSTKQQKPLNNHIPNNNVKLKANFSLINYKLFHLKDFEKRYLPEIPSIFKYIFGKHTLEAVVHNGKN